MATVRMSDGLKAHMTRALRRINPPKDLKSARKEMAAEVYALWLESDEGKLVKEVVALGELGQKLFLDSRESVKILRINDESAYLEFTSPTGEVLVPKSKGYSEFNIRVNHPDAEYLAQELRDLSEENKRIGEENRRVDAEIAAMLRSAPTLNGVLKKYPFLREVVPQEALDTLAKKAPRSAPKPEPVTEEDQLSLDIQRKLKVSIVAKRVGGE